MWTPDERVALTGDYRPLLGLLGSVDVGTLFLELATPRAGGLGILAELRTTAASASASSTRSGARSRRWKRSSHVAGAPSTSWARLACC